MNKYDVTKTLGEGAFGCVYMARNKTSNVVVAIKHIKRQFMTWRECLEERELKSLRKCKGHPSIVSLQELIHQNNELYFVFEFVTSNLMNVIEETRDGFAESKIKSMFVHLLGGLAHMHRQGFFHRDIKPENLLCQPDGSRLQIADLGCAREIRSRPPYTDYTSTRWYRAPEVVMRSTVYSSPIDMWACGCILAELYTRRALFPGKSMPDMILRICKARGTPTEKNWPEGMKMAAKMKYQFPRQNDCLHLHDIVPNASREAVSIIGTLLSWDW